MSKKGDQTHTNIIEKSLQLFSVKGYYNTSINDILRATHLTKGGLYGHFKSKKEIWYAVYDKAVEIWKRIVFKNVRNISNPLERIEKFTENVLIHYLGENTFEGGCFFVNMSIELSGQSPEMSSHVFHGFYGFYKLLRLWLKEAEQKGMLKDGLDLWEVSRFLSISLCGAATLYIASKDPKVLEQTLNQLRFYIKQLKSD